MSGDQQEIVTLRTPEQMEWIRERFMPDGLQRLAHSTPDYYEHKGYYLPDVAALAYANGVERDALARRLADLEERYAAVRHAYAMEAQARGAAEARETTLREALEQIAADEGTAVYVNAPTIRRHARAALAAVPSPATGRELFKDVPRVPMCTVVTQSSWHAPVRCAYALNHPGEHSWATIPAFPPAAESCPNTYCRDGWVPFEPNESNAAPPIPCRHPDCPSRQKSSPAADGEGAEA